MKLLSDFCVCVHTLAIPGRTLLYNLYRRPLLVGVTMAPEGSIPDLPYLLPHPTPAEERGRRIGKSAQDLGGSGMALDHRLLPPARLGAAGAGASGGVCLWGRRRQV